MFYDGIWNGYSEYDGKWFRASASGDAAFKLLLAERGVALAASLPATGGASPDWPVLLGVIAALILAGGIAARPYAAAMRRGLGKE